MYGFYAVMWGVVNEVVKNGLLVQILNASKIEAELCRGLEEFGIVGINKLLLLKQYKKLLYFCSHLIH